MICVCVIDTAVHYLTNNSLSILIELNEPLQGIDTFGWVARKASSL